MEFVVLFVPGLVIV